MTEFIQILIGAAALALGTGVFALIVFLWKSGRTLAAIPSRVGRLEEHGEILFRMNVVQLDGVKAILEAHKGQINGNVERAMESVTKIRDEATAYLTSAATMGATK